MTASTQNQAKRKPDYQIFKTQDGAPSKHIGVAYLRNKYQDDKGIVIVLNNTDDLNGPLRAVPSSKTESA